ncbi:MAG TPA: hypothetical protein VHP83_00040, partial [Aggregatilineaceae bacterium]|nr:hypothetical protein [Aggregatilineaceae bacterium]
LKSKLETEELATFLSQQQRVDRDLAFDTIKESVENFWILSETTINQLLHRLMQDRRFVVLDGEIIGVSVVAERRGKRRRGRIGKTK